MGVPAPAVRHYVRMQRRQAAAVLAARRAWAGVDPSRIAESWREILSGTALVSTVGVHQLAAAESGASYGAQTLAAQGVYDAPEAFVNPSAFVGFAGSGAPVEAALYGGALRSLHWLKLGMSTPAAMAGGRSFVEQQASTAVGDAGRSAAGVDTFSRPKTGYVRMLNPPSCARCAVLAGKFYRHNEGFCQVPGLVEGQRVLGFRPR